MKLAEKMYPPDDSHVQQFELVAGPRRHQKKKKKNIALSWRTRGKYLLSDLDAVGKVDIKKDRNSRIYEITQKQKMK